MMLSDWWLDSIIVVLLAVIIIQNFALRERLKDLHAREHRHLGV